MLPPVLVKQLSPTLSYAPDSQTFPVESGLFLLDQTAHFSLDKRVLELCWSPLEGVARDTDPKLLVYVNNNMREASLI